MTTVELPIGNEIPFEIYQVTPFLAVGTMIGTVTNMRRLSDDGFTHVINLQHDFDDATILGDLRIGTYWLPTIDVASRSEVRSVLRLAKKALANPEAKVLVHCMAGRNRSPRFAYVMLVRLGFAPHEAMAMIKAAIPDALVEPEDLKEIAAIAGVKAP